MSKRAPAIYAASEHGRSGYVQAAPRWHGTGLVTGPTENGLGESQHNVQCEHEHESIEAARACGLALARREAARRDREARRDYLASPCRIEIIEDRMWHDEPPRYIKTCQAHKQHATYLREDRAEAEAEPWTCPWSRFVRSEGSETR